MDLLKTDWDTIEKMIEEALQKHIRGFEFFEYFVINSDQVLVKIYNKTSNGVPYLAFTVKLLRVADRLEVREVY